MHEEPCKPTENQILAALPREDYDRISSHLKLVSLVHGQVLYQADQQIEYVYFPTNSMISLVSQLAEGENIEVGVIGFEGMAGLPVIC